MGSSNVTENMLNSYSLSICEDLKSLRDPSRVTSTSLTLSRVGISTTALGCPIAIFLNGLMLVTFYKTSSLQTKSNTIILALAVSDFVKSLVMPLSVIKEAIYQKGIESNCYIDALMANLGLHVVTELILCALNCERFIGVRFPVWHRVHVTKARLVKIVAVCYITGITIVLWRTLSSTGRFPMMLSAIVATLATIIFVVLIWRTILKRNRRFMKKRVEENAALQKNRPKTQGKEERKIETDDSKAKLKNQSGSDDSAQGSSSRSKEVQAKGENICQQKGDKIEILTDLEIKTRNQNEINPDSAEISQQVIDITVKRLDEYSCPQVISQKKAKKGDKEEKRDVLRDLEKGDVVRDELAESENISQQIIHKNAKRQEDSSQAIEFTIQVQEVSHEDGITKSVKDLKKQSCSIVEHLDVQQRQEKQPQRIQIQAETARKDTKRSLVSNAEKKAAKIATYLAFCLFLTRIMPMAIFTFTLISTSNAAPLIDCLAYLTPVINPLIYGGMNENIRKASMSLINRQ